MSQPPSAKSTQKDLHLIQDDNHESLDFSYGSKRAVYNPEIYTVYSQPAEMYTIQRSEDRNSVTIGACTPPSHPGNSWKSHILRPARPGDVPLIRTDIPDLPVPGFRTGWAEFIASSDSNCITDPGPEDRITWTLRPTVRKFPAGFHDEEHDYPVVNGYGEKGEPVYRDCIPRWLFSLEPKPQLITSGNKSNRSVRNLTETNYELSQKDGPGYWILDKVKISVPCLQVLHSLEGDTENPVITSMEKPEYTFLREKIKEEYLQLIAKQDCF